MRRRCAFCGDGEDVTRISDWDAMPLTAPELVPFIEKATVKACDDCAYAHELTPA